MNLSRVVLYNYYGKSKIYFSCEVFSLIQPSFSLLFS